ncbi:unnamed protein product [Closterium sp. Naga37s-1]|nr:unnamed protein product [Closterium sp. Naga37s-1]
MTAYLSVCLCTTSLGLYSQGLHGSSLRAIALLTRLEFIDLESNAFHCHLPKTFSRLLHLTYLDVSKNLLYGPLPDFSHLPLERHSCPPSHLASLVCCTWACTETSSHLMRPYEPKFLPPRVLRSLLSPPLPSLSSAPLSLLCSPLSSLLPSLSSAPLSLLCSPLSPLLPSLSSAPLSLLCSPLSPLLPSLSSAPLSLLCSPLSPLLPSLSSAPLSLLCSPLSPLLPSLSFAPLSLLCSSGAIPAALTARLTRLLHLGLHSNQLSGAIPPLDQLKQLATLQLAFNPFTPAPLPPSIPRLTSLVLVLDLSATNLRGPLPDLSALVGVSDLLLDFNGLDGPLNPMYLPSGRLGFFSGGYTPIGITNLQGPLPDVSALVGNSDLLLDFNGLDGPLDPFFLPSGRLGCFAAHSNNFSGPISPHLATPLASPIFSILDSGLILANNSFSGRLPGSLGRLVQSYVVDVSHNHLSGRIPPSFGTLYQLTRFLLNDNAFTSAIPTELGIATGLRVLRLAGNRLSGTVPATFTALTRLQELDLSRNHLVASLPDLSTSLHRLTLLNTSRNFLSGPLPSHLPASLLSLDLSNNFFSGSLPGSSDWLPKNATARLHGNCLQLPSCPVPPNLRSSFGAKLRDSFGPNLRAGSACWLARQRSEGQCASFCGANESVTRVCR